jgi:hypothetical protein
MPVPRRLGSDPGFVDPAYGFQRRPEVVPEGSVAEVLEWVGDSPLRASEALEAEQAGQQRTTLVEELEKRQE